MSFANDLLERDIALGRGGEQVSVELYAAGLSATNRALEDAISALERLTKG